MSMQAGIWNFDGEPIGRELLASFGEQLRAQGPDGNFTYIDGNIAMLYLPFHSTAESRREKQPYVSETGSILTWDGRLDNREDLVADLRADLDQNATDVQIVATAFDRWGADCFRRIVGDWALSILEPKQQDLIFAVDYLAIRHIFYYLRKSHIWWSSDLAPLILSSGEKLHIDEHYVAGYLANDPQAQLTPYREIHQVPPGQFVRIRNGIPSCHRYWSFNPNCRIRYKTDREYEDRFREIFRQSVRRRLRSDSPVLAELSGGLDSSSIVSMADEVLANEGAQTPRLGTLSYYDKTEPNGDDWIYFQLVERHRGRVGSHIDVSGLGASSARLQNDGFMSFPGRLAAGRDIEHERARMVREGGFRVVLSGLGGDEFMGGIPNPQAVLADLLVQFQPVRLARELTQWALVKRQPWIQLLLQAMVVLLPIEVRRHLNHRIATPRWIENQFARRTKFTRLLHSGHETAFPAINFFGPSQRAAITGLFSMANKLAKYVPPPQCVEEFRYPYLDQDLITFVFSIPASQLLRPGERRSLMRRALLDIVPKEILSRRTKQFGARTPALLLDSRWEELESTVQSSLSSRLGFVDRNRLAEALQDVRCGKEIQIVRLLKAVSLEFWLRDLASRDVVYIPGATKSWPDQESPSRNTFRKRSVNEFFGALS